MAIRNLWLETALGVVFVFSGIVNIFGLGEDIHIILTAAAHSLDDTRLSPLAGLIETHWYQFLVPVCLAMIVSGIFQIRHSRWAGWGAIFQLVMMLGFVTLLHRAFPEIIFADGVLAIGLILLLNQKPEHYRL